MVNSSDVDEDDLEDVISNVEDSDEQSHEEEESGALTIEAGTRNNEMVQHTNSSLFDSLDAMFAAEHSTSSGGGAFILFAALVFCCALVCERALRLQLEAKSLSSSLDLAYANLYFSPNCKAAKRVFYGFIFWETSLTQCAASSANGAFCWIPQLHKLYLRCLALARHACFKHRAWNPRRCPP